MFMAKILYTNITSPFIKEKLINTNWSNHSYIDSLILLDKYIRKSPKSYTSSVLFHSLKNKYQKEFLALCKEYSISRYEKELLEIEMEAQKQKVKVIKNKKRDEDNRNNWIKAGGLE